LDFGAFGGFAVLLVAAGQTISQIGVEQLKLQARNAHFECFGPRLLAQEVETWTFVTPGGHHMKELTLKPRFFSPTAPQAIGTTESATTS
jgi:hypothetical protein